MKTPCYIFNSEQLYNDYVSMKKKLNEVILHYSLKPNANRNIIRMLNQFHCHFEFSSCNEFDLLTDENVSTNHMIFGLPIKEVDDITYLYNHGVKYFVFDSINELEKLVNYAYNSKKICRLNVMHLGNKNISYGMNLNEIEELFHSNSAYLKHFDGFSFHITRNTEIEAELQMLDEIEVLLDKFEKGQIKIINIGGGYGLSTPGEYYILLNRRLKHMKKNIIWFFMLSQEEVLFRIVEEY